MEEIVASSVSDRRLNLVLLGIFAALALVVSTVGIYGVISYSVAQRTREFGIRMALGARASDIVPLVMRRALALVALGIALGTGAAVAVTRALAHLLPAAGTDSTTLTVAGLLMLSTALVAAVVPSLAAARVDPAVALKEG